MHTLNKLLKIRTTDSNSPPPNFLNQWGHAYLLNSFCCLDDPLPINEGSDYDGEGDVTLNSNISSHFHGSGEGVYDGGFLKGAGGAVKDG